MAAGVGACAVLAACGGSSAVHVDEPASATARGCPALVKALPHDVDGQSARTTSGYAQAAAWGDPAIVLRCGVPKPAGFTRVSGCQVVNGVGWFLPSGQVSDDDADLVITLLHRRPRVEVTVPAHYRPQGPGSVLVDLAHVIKEHTTRHGHCA